MLAYWTNLLSVFSSTAQPTRVSTAVIPAAGAEGRRLEVQGYPYLAGTANSSLDSVLQNQRQKDVRKEEQEGADPPWQRNGRAAHPCHRRGCDTA